MNKRDNIRLKQFRQLKKEIRGSKGYLIVGIDVAKDKHNAFFGTATGKNLFKRLVFENTIEGFKRLLIQEDAIKLQHALKKTVFGLEGAEEPCVPQGDQKHTTKYS
jgi:transposase